MSSSGGNQKIGVKKALVFYGGKPPKGIKTNWIMHEYRLINDGNQSSTSSTIASRTIAPPNISNKKNSLRLDDWVLCRIYKKHNSTQPRPILEHECNREEQILGGHATVSQQLNMPTKHINNCDMLLENNENFFEGMLNEGMTSTTSLSQLVSCNNSNKPELSMATARWRHCYYHRDDKTKSPNSILD
ncbi:hypothetical protein Syun_008329 [Stephania yunnanensis]|uniref:NAC domain-containing protein n=1 Tax=Stephania yunnanensis TaxID=152371 RepID=A0AAP0KDJ4_9MAGN